MFRNGGGFFLAAMMCGVVWRGDDEGSVCDENERCCLV